MIALTIVAVLLIVVLAFQQWRFDRERERWAAERQRLVNAAIARHAGEVVALNRIPKDTEHKEPFYIEGIS